MKKMRPFFAFFLFISTSFFHVSGQTLQLTGSPQYVRIGDLDISGNQVTVEALVKFTGGVNIVSKHTAPADVNYLMRIGTFELTTTTQFYLMSNPYAGSMQPNTWYHVAGTYDGSFIRYYVNGCLIVEQPATGNLVVNNLVTGVGNQSSCQCEQFNGEIDELRIWSAARTQAELSANMFDLPSPTTQANLRAYYKFDGNTTNLQGNTAYDGVWVGTPAYGAQPVASAIPAMGIQSVSHTDLTCFQSGNGGIAVTATGSGLNYSLDGSTWQTSNQFSNLAAGNYTIYIKSQEGCIMSGNQTAVAQPAQLTVTATPTPVTSCTTPNGSVTATPSGGTSPYTYAWTPTGTGATISNLPVGNYSVQVTDQHGCQATASATVTGNTPVQLTLASSSNVTCNGAANGTAVVQPSGGTAPFTYNWTPGGASVANPSNLGPGTYTATVTDAGGCTASASVTITEPAPLVLTQAITQPTCGETDGQITVTASGGNGNYTYLWTPTGANTNVLSNAGGGSYTVTVSSGSNCSANATYTLVPAGNLGLSATPSTFSYHAGDDIPLTAATVITTNVSIFWAPDPSLSCTACPNPTAAPGGGDETYTVYATTPDGCIDSVQVFAKIIIPCTDIFVPTIFSPNGDGQNDMITVMGNCIQEMKFIVYDRWGEKVFEAISAEDPWDGYYKGKPANTGAYVYKLNIVHSDGTQSERSGNITLTR